MDFDPVTRVAGALAFHTVADFKARKVLEARSMATLFRGYEVIMVGRDPRDAIYITSRACGVCGGVHSVTSAMAIEMAIGCVPPPLGILVRNLALALEFLYDHPLHLHLLAGPDYSAAMVGPTNPSLLARARSTEAPHAEIHGFRTIGELMEDLNPLSGKLYLEALHMTRVAREAYVLICGKYPHPQTIVPGGMSSTITLTRDERDVHAAGPVLRLQQEARGDLGRPHRVLLRRPTQPTSRSGSRRAHMIDTGIFDHPDAYDATYANAGAWGDRRWATPGVIVDGELVTTDLHKLNMGVEEFVEHSYYEEWAGSGQRQRFPTDPAGQPALALSPVEQGDQAAAARAELEGEVHLGHGAALGSPVHGGRRLRTSVEHGRRAEAARQPLHRVDGNVAQDAPAEGRAARDGDRVARARGLERVRAQSRRGRTAWPSRPWSR